MSYTAAVMSACTLVGFGASRSSGVKVWLCDFGVLLLLFRLTYCLALGIYVATNVFIAVLFLCVCLFTKRHPHGHMFLVMQLMFSNFIFCVSLCL